jgi:HSP20 family protein
MLNNFFNKTNSGSASPENRVQKTEEDFRLDPWLEEKQTEGQLSIDVYQTTGEIIVKSTLAGVKPEDLKISLHNDLLTIKGKREEQQTIAEEDYLYKECYWGSFSRSIILPAEVEENKVQASLENGVLTITLKKTHRNQSEIKITN